MLDRLHRFSNISTLRYFYEVARCGSLRAAADSIHIAPSAISRQIRILEDDLGVELFTRGRTGVSLTSAGEVLLYHVRRAMNELDYARTEIDAQQGQHRGSVVIGVNETIAREFMTQFLIDFHGRHPGIVPHMIVGNTAALVDLLLRGDIEIMVGYGVPDHHELERMTSFQLVTCVMLNREHRLARRDTVSVDDLTGEKIIMPDASLSLRQTLDNMFVQAALRPTPVLVTNSFEMMANLVAAGVGVGAQIRLRPGPDNVRANIIYVPITGSRAKPVSLACCVRSGRVPSVTMSICAQNLNSALHQWTQKGDAQQDHAPPAA